MKPDYDLWLESGPGGPADDSDIVAAVPCGRCGDLCQLGDTIDFDGADLCQGCYDFLTEPADTVVADE